MEGTVKESKDNVYKIDIQGHDYSVESEKIYSVNDQVEMVVRPESVVIGKEDYKTTVKKSLFMGENHEYEVEWNGQILQISGSNPFGKRI